MYIAFNVHLKILKACLSINFNLKSKKMKQVWTFSGIVPKLLTWILWLRPSGLAPFTNNNSKTCENPSRTATWTGDSPLRPIPFGFAPYLRSVRTFSNKLYFTAESKNNFSFKYYRVDAIKIQDLPANKGVWSRTSGLSISIPDKLHKQSSVCAVQLIETDEHIQSDVLPRWSKISF